MVRKFTFAGKVASMAFSAVLLSQSVAYAGEACTIHCRELYDIDMRQACIMAGGVWDAACMPSSHFDTKRYADLSQAAADRWRQCLARCAG